MSSPIQLLDGKIEGEALGALFHGYTTACTNLKILANLKTKEYLSTLAFDGWCPLQYLMNFSIMIRQTYRQPEAILEKLGITMMDGWYHQGPGKEFIKKGEDFLSFQTGAMGYQSVVRGPVHVVGKFDLVEFYKEECRGIIHSTTPFDRDIERGVIIGGMLAPGDISFVNVDNSKNPNIYHIYWHKRVELTPSSSPKQEKEELYWENLGLKNQINRDAKFWMATNDNLAQAYERLEESKKELALVSHQLGMAETAIHLLHHVGNRMNSISVSSSSILEHAHEHIKQDKFAVLLKFLENKEALLDETKRSRFCSYLSKLGETLKQDYAVMAAEAASIGAAVEKVNSVLNLQKNYADKKKTKDEVDIVSVLRNTIKNKSAKFLDHKVQIKQDFSDALVFLVHGESLRFNIVFEELLNNAFESVVQQCEKSIIVRLDKQEHHIVIKIIDSGKGIEPHILHQIFTPGFTTKREKTGFGLHDSANLIHDMGGTLEIKSEGVGKGAVAEIILPLLVASNQLFTQ